MKLPSAEGVLKLALIASTVAAGAEVIREDRRAVLEAAAEAILLSDDVGMAQDMIRKLKEEL